MKNTEGAGAAKPKTGPNRAALDRAAGMGQALSAIQNKTKTRYPASKHANHYYGCGGYGDNENILGYGKNG